MNEENIIKIIPKRRKRKVCAGRIQEILDKHYGNVIGTGETENCLKELIADMKWFCRIAGRKFDELTK